MLERIHKGDRTIPSQTWNQMADFVESALISGADASGGTAPLVITVRNETGENLNFGDCVAVESPLFDVPDESEPDENEKYRHFHDRTYKVVKPESGKSLAVVTVPMSPDDLGRVVLSGVVRAIVDVKNTSHKRVTFTPDTVKLESSDDGDLSFFIKPTSTGKQWCDLLFGGKSGSPIIVDTLTSTLTSTTYATTQGGRTVCDPLMMPSRIYEAGTKVKISQTADQIAPWIVIHGDHYSRNGCFVQPTYSQYSRVVEGVTKYYTQLTSNSTYDQLTPKPTIQFNPNVPWAGLQNPYQSPAEIELPYPVFATFFVNDWSGTIGNETRTTTIKSSPIVQYQFQGPGSSCVKSDKENGAWLSSDTFALSIPGLGDLADHPEYKIDYRSSLWPQSVLKQYTGPVFMSELLPSNPTSGQAALIVQLSLNGMVYTAATVATYQITTG